MIAKPHPATCYWCGERDSSTYTLDGDAMKPTCDHCYAPVPDVPHQRESARIATPAAILASLRAGPATFAEIALALGITLRERAEYDTLAAQLHHMHKRGDIRAERLNPNAKRSPHRYSIARTA